MSYEKQTWADGDVITADKLNHLEDGVESENAILESIIDRTITSISSDTLTSIGDYAFGGCSSLTTADFPLATNIGIYAFDGCSSLTTADFPVATSIGEGAFRGCSSLTTADFPVATSIGISEFESCSSLTTVDFPAATSIGDNAFGGCEALTAADFPVATSIGDYAFGGCEALTAVILRANQVVTVGEEVFESSDNAFIYVPDNLVSSYKSDANWSTYASRIKGISELLTT